MDLHLQLPQDPDLEQEHSNIQNQVNRGRKHQTHINVLAPTR